MTIFDLLFVALFLFCFVAVVSMGVAAMRGNRVRVRTIAARVAQLLGAYTGVLVLVSIGSAQRVIAVGVDQCSDDWCIAADSVRREEAAGRMTYTVGLRLSSRARRAAQRERFVVVYLRDDTGARFDAAPDSTEVPFDTLLQAGQTIRAVRRFAVPVGAKHLSLVIAREGGFGFPGCCIIGDEGSLLHKRTIVRLD